MIPFHNLYSQIKKYGISHQSLYILSIMIFFYSIFDGIVTYIFPLAIEQQGYNKTIIGVIIGSSSMVGALFDFILSKYIQNATYRRMYFLMYSICFTVPITLFAARPLWLFFLAAGLWGIYFDLRNFGNFDFIGRTIPHKDHASSFGILWIFGALGYMIAPILTGLLIGEIIDWKPYVLMYAMIAFSMFFFIILILITRRTIFGNKTTSHKPRNLLREIHIWKRIGKTLFPILVLTLLLNVFDAFFWTLGPLISENMKNLNPFNGVFLTIYELPSLLVGWFVGSITSTYGKKTTAFVAFIAGSLLMSIFPFMQNSLFMLAIIFLSSCLIAIAWPSINGAYADYIAESNNLEGEIEAVQDFATNIGYIVGPIIAGLLADQIGIAPSFVILGITSATVALIFWLHTPNKITVKA